MWSAQLCIQGQSFKRHQEVPSPTPILENAMLSNIGKHVPVSLYWPFNVYLQDSCVALSCSCCKEQAKRRGSHPRDSFVFCPSASRCDGVPIRTIPAWHVGTIQGDSSLLASDDYTFLKAEKKIVLGQVQIKLVSLNQVQRKHGNLLMTEALSS